jgi:WD40 repeat protein
LVVRCRLPVASAIDATAADELAAGEPLHRYLQPQETQMGRIIVAVTLGAVLFLSGAYYLGLMDDFWRTSPPTDGKGKVDAADVSKLPNLYDPAPFPKIPDQTESIRDTMRLEGTLSAVETQEVACQMPGGILFIGEQIDETTVAVAGSAAFLAEPYYSAPIYAGKVTYTKFYRRLYEGDTVRKDQMLAMIEPAKALGEVLSKIAKIGVARADLKAAKAGEDEGNDRHIRAYKLWRAGALAEEEYGSARLTALKLKGERESAEEKLVVAEVEKDQSEIELDMFRIRAKLAYQTYSIKSLVKQQGAAAKQGDTIMVVQSLERLQAEALIEQQYYARLKDKKLVTATIEPTVIEAPHYEFPGHALDVTTVAVARDMHIVSGSEDRTVCVWKIGALAPLKRFEHETPVRVVACTPAKDGTNLCIAGCDDGSIYLWDLDADEAKQREPIPKAHGNDNGITALAFSPDGKSFASGASDGSIRIWSADGKERYAFVPEKGVASAHEDAVTALQFTPQCRLVSAGRDKTLRIWKLKDKGAEADGKPIRDRDGNVARPGVSHDGKWMLFDQSHAHSLNLLSVESRLLKHTINLPVNAQPFETFAIFSPDDSLILTAGAPENRMQLWRVPEGSQRSFEVRQFATRERKAVSCAAFSPEAGKGGDHSFAVSGSGHKLYVWTIPTEAAVKSHRITNVPLTFKTLVLDPTTKQARIAFEIANSPTPEHPNGRFEAGRPAVIVIE